MDLTDEYIQSLVDNHKKKLQYYSDRYHNIKKHDPEYMKSNRERARLHYEKNKEKKKENYEKNKPLMRAKNSYYYYKKINKLDDFKTKHTEKYDLLVKAGSIASYE
tara:strand:- start:5228 stop:5545 length:318 start_codon:yes stop_codon:yes gene_type:complete